MKIEYRDIPGFDGYRAGSDGSIWSCWKKFHQAGRTGSLSRKTSQWKTVPARLDRYGYPQVSIRRTGCAGASIPVHQLILFAFVGPRPDKSQACHGNGIRTDNSVGNLRWDTASANQQDALRHGTKKTGLSSTGMKFISLWNSCADLSEFCKRTKKTRRRAISSATSYRAQGHKLKYYPTRPPYTALPGERFGRWVVIRIVGEKRGRLCKCDCGKQRVVDAGSLISGTSKSCSCGRKPRGKA